MARQAADTGSGSAVARYLRAATSDSTKRAYETDLRHFCEWGGTIPATEQTVAEYLAAHAEKLSVATLERRLAAISKVHAVQGLPSPTRTGLVRTTLRGIRRCHGRPQRRVSPLLRDDLAAIVSAMDCGLRDVRDRALLLVGFAGAFRRSELSDIGFTDVEWVAGGVVIVLRRSKTDQERRGRRVGFGRGQGAMCPVAALDAWLAAARIAEGPLFRAVSRHGRISDRRLSPEAVARVVKARAATAGLDPERYSGHSLRAGLVTSAAREGVPTWRIREQTGHRSEAMLQRYIRDADMFPVEVALKGPE